MRGALPRRAAFVFAKSGHTAHMRIYSDPNLAHVVIDNRLARLEARAGGDGLSLQLSALTRARAAIPILVRAGRNTFAGAWQVERPEQCSLEIDQVGNTAALIVNGTVGEADYAISLRLAEGSRWVEVNELLCLDALQATVKVGWFEAVWQFADWQEPGEVFSPLLVPEPNDVIGRHVMRSPALTAQCGDRVAALVYSIDSIHKMQALPACMNLLRKGDGRAPVFRAGLRPHKVRGHVYFTHEDAPASQTRFHFAYHLYAAANARPGAALDAANRKLWSGWGTRHLRAAPPAPMTYEEYARQIYPRVIAQRWAETQLDGRRIGAIRINRAYPNDVWMCPWFSQIRSAYGLYLWGKWLNESDWVERAIATRDLHLAAPQDRGFFPTVFVFGDTPQTCRWVHSQHQGGGPGVYHLADMSWTVAQLLRWHHDLIPDARTLAFARDYCKGILAVQRADGGLPALVDAHTFAPVNHLDRQALLADLEAHSGGDGYVPAMLRRHWVEERFVESAEDATSLLALAEMARVLPPQDPDRAAFVEAARRVASWLETWVYPEARWIDFEVYYSCSPKPLDFYDRRSGQWPQNTLNMHTAAAGMLALYELTNDSRYLDLARRAMDRLSLYQQVWDPPFLNVYGFGGYGVMNTDGEWHDARLAQFGDTHLDFYRRLGDVEHLERALAARRAGFITIYLPANASVYPTGWNRLPRSIAAENHAHGGTDHLCGVSGFDWGAGSALATAAYFRLRGVE